MRVSETKKYEKNTQNEKFSDTNAARAASVGIVEECGANGKTRSRYVLDLFPFSDGSTNDQCLGCIRYEQTIAVPTRKNAYKIII